ncbi:MAG TPA: universal stress protein [Anaerolineae bacterium]|nr:universal stress protein [Anaerolineae bacterium]
MSNDSRPAFLSLRDLTPDRAAARLLPLNVARTCRALPIAEDSGCITVAMADPADRAAREVVTASLLERAAGQADGSRQVYLVQGDPALIDMWLANLALDNDATASWSDLQPLDIWLREPLHSDKAAIGNYAAQIAALLATQLRRFDPLAMDCGWPDFADSPAHRLMILPCLDYNLPRPLQANSDGCAEAVMFACRPRWPLRRLLLIARGDPVDDAALAWATRLARASGAATTALMIAPHLPSSHALPAHDDISSLLSTNNTTGHKMQHTAQRLAALQLDAVLHLRQGAPDVVIREELASTPYDLGIAGVAVRNGDAQWRLRPLLHKLLLEMNCPLLLTAGSSTVIGDQ